MRYLSALLIVLLTASISFGFITVPTPAGGASPDFRYVQIAKVDVNGDAAVDANFGTWADSNVTNASRVFVKPDSWTWLKFQLYFHGAVGSAGDGNDANVGQADFNCYSGNTYGGLRRQFGSTVFAGNEALSNDPNTGAWLRTNHLPDPNSKWANADANFIDKTDCNMFRADTAGTSSTYGVLTYTVIAIDKFWRVRISIISPAAKLDYVYCVVTGGK